MVASSGPGLATEHKGTKRRWTVPGRLFPLPLPAVEQRPRPTLSRACRQRVLRKVRTDGDVHNCVAALNWLSGFRSAAAGPVSAAQGESSSLLRDAVCSRGPPDSF